MTSTVPTREAVPADEKWDIESVFADESAWRAALTAALARAPAIAAHAGHLGDSGARLWEALSARDALGLEAYRIIMYAQALLSTDGTNQRYAAMMGEASGALAQLMGAMAFFDPELLALSAARLTALMAEEPRLSRYQHAFDRLRVNAAHVRSAEVEQVMAMAQSAFATGEAVAEAANNADMTFAPIEHDGKRIPITQSTVMGLMGDAALRKPAWEAYSDGNLALQNVLAAALQGTVRAHVFQARARGYKSSLEMSLSRNHIPTHVYENLLATFEENLPTWHRFWRLRQKAAGGTFRTCDTPVYGWPAALSGATAMSYDEARQVILAGMAPLGEEYLAPMRRGLYEERWVDRARNIGKGGGAYSSGAPGTHPFIFMSWNDTILSMSTLAHELGHSMHSYFTFRDQPSVYADYGLFVAEVASNFNQAMVRAHLLKTETDPQRRLAILDEAFMNFHRYLFTMPTLARFERGLFEKVEAGGALTAPEMGERFAALFAEGYGGAVEMDTRRLGAGWMGFGHLHAPFYVYQYATGIAAANALASQVLAEGAPAAARYLRFLKAGGSMYPLDALRLAGIDMDSPEPVRRGFAILASLVDQLEAVLAGPTAAAGAR